MTREVGLVEEADLDGHFGGRMPGKEESAGPVDSPADHVGVRGESEGRGEVS
jgi:hypothetical protein